MLEPLPARLRYEESRRDPPLSRSQRRRLRLLVGLACVGLIAFLGGCFYVYAFLSATHGHGYADLTVRVTVVDAHSGEPLGDTVVAVVRSRAIFDDVIRFRTELETGRGPVRSAVADANGHVAIEAQIWTTVYSSPFGTRTERHPPDCVAVVLPGHEPFVFDCPADLPAPGRALDLGTITVDID